MIKVVALVENTAVSSEYGSKHGLSLYIETPKHKILFDLGQDGLFLQNAKKKNIDIADIDTVIISHGHKDHGGALKAFMAVNTKAKIYVKEEAFEPHYIKVFGLPFNVGLDKKLSNHSQIVFSENEMQIDDELLLFSDVKENPYPLKSNGVLYTKRHGRFVLDDFRHEQNLVIGVEGKTVLVSGCSHSGIVNIQNKAEKLINNKISTVIGGFHLYNPPTKKYENMDIIDGVANELFETQSSYLTCHCTGIKAFERMKGVLGERLKYLSAGEELLI